MPSRRTPDPFAVQLGERIRQLRREKGLSLNALARVSGLSRGHVSDIEHGKVVMTLGTLVRLAVPLDTPPFVICMIPWDEPDIAGIAHVLSVVGGDSRKAAERIRALVLGLGSKPSKGPTSDS